MKRKIGLTGATGFIGKYLVRDYHDQFDFVAATSRKTVPNLSEIVEVYRVDYSVESFLEAFAACDAVVHLGAMVPDTVYGLGSVAEYSVNVTTSENLLKAAVELGIKKIINISSVAIYDRVDCSPIKENQQFAPCNAYGVSKATVELMANAYSKYYGLNIISLRVAQVLGDKEYKKPCFFSMLEDNAYHNRNLTVYGTGKATRDIIYVKDVAYAVVCALNSQANSGPYNIGTGKGVSNLELAKAFIEGYESKSEITFVPVQSEDTWNWYLDISKAQKELGFVPQYDLISMVRDIKKEMEKRLILNL